MRSVRLLSIQYVSENGRQVKKYPGEWVQVGKATALSWIASGQADRPDMPDLKALPGCGAVLTGGSRSAALPGLDTVRADRPRLEYARTMLWSGVNFRGDLLATGFSLLDTWEVVAPLLSYTKLARDVGDEWDRQATQDVIHDLRVPVYDVRLLFLRRCSATRDLLDAWTNDDGDRSLAFLRALYRVKPLVLALPTTWLLP